jgi:succinate dehydrogenase/fumarate reductase-like Fe-S protein
MGELEKINITLKVWRQKGPQERGRFENIPAEDVDSNMSFLEMLDALNEKLILEDKEPIEFDNSTCAHSMMVIQSWSNLSELERLK